MKGVIGFLAGAACGSLLAWYFTKKKYEEIANEEIKSVKEYYKEEYAKESSNTEMENDTNEPEEMEEENKEEMYTIIDEKRYSNAEKGDRTGSPYVITPDEFASTNQFYDKISLSYYTTGELENEGGGELYSTPEIEKLIGVRNLDRMGEYEPDVLYVRNDALQTDFEVIDEGEDYHL